MCDCLLKLALLTKFLYVQLLLLVSEFLVGMFVNLFETVPFSVDFAEYAYSLQGVGFGVHP